MGLGNVNGQEVGEQVVGGWPVVGRDGEIWCWQSTQRALGPIFPNGQREVNTSEAGREEAAGLPPKKEET